MKQTARLLLLAFFSVAISSYAFLPNSFAKEISDIPPSDSAQHAPAIFGTSTHPNSYRNDSTDSLSFWDGYTTTGSDSSIIIYQNYPNPFSGTTNIIFQIADPTLYGQEISIIVYDELGLEIELLYDDLADDAIHSTTFDGSFFKSGFYLCAAQCGGHAVIRLMNLVH